MNNVSHILTNPLRSYIRSKCASPFLCLPKERDERKGSPIVRPAAPWKLFDLGRHANTRIHARVHSVGIPAHRPTEIDQKTLNKPYNQYIDIR